MFHFSFEKQQSLIRNSYENAKIINNLHEREQEELILADITNIYWIHNPTLKIQLKVIETDHNLYKNIKKPYYETKLAALKKCGDHIEYMSDPEEELQQEAVNNDPRSIYYIKLPTFKVQLYAALKGVYDPPYKKYRPEN